MRDILNKTRQDYNLIAKHFNSKRRYVWEDLKPYLKLVKPGNKVLDAGCGNGRLLTEFKNKNIDYLGIDFSKNLLKIAKKNYPNYKFNLADITKENTFKNLKNYDICFCIAVLHHLAAPALQLKVLNYIYKTLKTNGILVISSWNLWQKKYWQYHFKQIFWKIKNKNLKFVKIPYKISDGKKITNKVNRYLYAYTKKEFENLVKEAGFKIIDKKTGKNLCLKARKMVKSY